MNHKRSNGSFFPGIKLFMPLDTPQSWFYYYSKHNYKQNFFVHKNFVHCPGHPENIALNGKNRELDGNIKMKPESINKIFHTMKTLFSSEKNIVHVKQEIKDLENSFIRAMHGILPSHMLCAKLLLHGIYENL